jgi:hypothetical protein
MYDILKVGHLHNIGAVNNAIFVLPMQEHAKLLGGNIASFDKIEKEYLFAYSKLIATPVELLGI